MTKGNFTLPGEAGYEKLTLELAQRWGADVIRDSDGTVLSEEILQSGYGIYSTICVIRDHNEWAREHPLCLQQTFLMTLPQTAHTNVLTIHLLDGYHPEQFRVNETPASLRRWQVFDRTCGKEIPSEESGMEGMAPPAFWHYDKESGCVVIQGTKPWHIYTVNFLSFRIWEEISMYNHITNDWGEREHLMPIDPRSEEAQAYLLDWMARWCKEHPATTVVRFTSLFYNFVWIWGGDERRRNLFTDWGSYDFTLSTLALEQFEKEYGYALTSEDFINQGKRNPNNLPPTPKMRDYMNFTVRFVTGFARQMVDIVHQYGKQAYLFYDDSWVGAEPYGGYFTQMGFDGLIKCVFNGYEVRQCAGVEVPVHEIRLHPYLFPSGLNGKPTFREGGEPDVDARQYWSSVRRALLREPIDRIGLGGYLHLTEGFPDFVDAMEEIADEFRMLRELHQNGQPYTLPIHVGILTSWGKLRTWSLSGNYSETSMHDLLHVLEALSGMPVEVTFLDFDDVRTQRGLSGLDVIVNAGRAGLAWTGGDAWEDERVLSALRRFVSEGGTFLGINEPSAREGAGAYFRLFDVLGVDEDRGAYGNCGCWPLEMAGPEVPPNLIPEGISLHGKENRILTDGNVSVVWKDCVPAEDSMTGLEQERPVLTVHVYGKGKGIYLSEFRGSGPNNRLLLNLLLYAKGLPMDTMYLTDNPDTECAFYQNRGAAPTMENRKGQTGPMTSVGKLIVINNSRQEQTTLFRTQCGTMSFCLPGYSCRVVELSGAQEETGSSH